MAGRRSRSTPRLPVTCLPEAGECLDSYLRRLTDINGHAIVSTFIRSLGLIGLGPESNDEMWTRLEFATGQGTDVLAGLRWQRMPNTARSGRLSSILGTGISPTFLDVTGLRFCPECLRERGFARQFWAIRYVAACPLHGCILRDKCSRCGRPSSRAVRPWACICGADLVDGPSQPAPAAAIRMARNLAAMIGSRTAAGVDEVTADSPLCKPFHALTAHDYIAYVHTLGRAATTEPSDDPPMTNGYYYRSGALEKGVTKEVMLSRITAAHEVLDDWPASYGKILASIETRTGGGAGERFMSNAFGTKIGRSLHAPIRDSRGVPLPLLVQAIDDYWDAKAGRIRRMRNLGIENPVARRLGKRIGPAKLAAALDFPLAQEMPRRILEVVLTGLDADELHMDDASLAALIHSRSIDLATKVHTSLSITGAMLLIEGTCEGQRLDAWNHPDLLPPDGEVCGLRLAGKEMYLRSSVDRVLARLDAIAVRVGQPGELKPLLAYTLRHAGIHSAYRKTELLLDMFRGRFRVYTTVDQPRLSDILVDHDEICAIAFSKRHGCGDGSPEFESKKRINHRLRFEFGASACLEALHFARLANLGLVRIRTERSRARGRDRDVVTRFFNTVDVVAVVRRWTEHGSSAAEMAALGPAVDIGAELDALTRSRLSAVEIAERLNHQAIRTETGLAWSQTHVMRVLRRRKTTAAAISALRTDES